MRPLKLIFLVMIIASGCDDRLDFANRDNTAPTIRFNNHPEGGALFDSLKLGASYTGGRYNEIIGTEAYVLRINALDLESELNNIAYSIQGDANVVMLLNGLPLAGNIPLSNTFVDVQIKATPGTHVVIFTVTDKIGKQAQATLTLFAFTNLPPVAHAVFNDIGTTETGPFEYEFDASMSFDKDRNHGGAVLTYEFVVNDTYTINTQSPKIRHHFAGPGTYRVRYRVVDNEGAASEYVLGPTIQL